MGKTAERIGRAIRLRRRALGLSQQELAEKCGLSKTYVARLELASSKRLENPSVDILDRLARALSCEPADFFSGSVKTLLRKTGKKERSRLLAECATKIEPEHLELLIDLARALRRMSSNDT